MAGLIPQSFIDDLLNRTDIVDVVGSRVPLKKTGKNYSACCPFHNEKTPSFSVSPDKQFYYCFGCGAGGNALGFLMDHDKLDFPQAVEELAQRAGLDVPREESRGQRTRQPVDSPLYPLMEAACEYYRNALRQHGARRIAVDYLKSRGLSGEIARDFGIGFAPPGWDNLLKHLDGDGLQQKALIDAGLLIENAETGRRYDRFRDRIMFPIRDSRGRVIAFGGRILGDDKPKYLNSPETPIFHKGKELYGLYEARQHNRDLDEIMVVEGYMDVIALAQQGLRNAVATLGTATSEEHIKRLFRVVPSIVFCFDGDAAGRKAAWRALEATLPSLKDGLRARFLFLPDGEDPDTLVRKEGTDAFLARLQQQARSLADYFFEQLCEEAQPNSLEGKAHLATLATPLIEQVPGVHLRQLMRHQLIQLTGLSEANLAQHASTPPQPEPYDDQGAFYANYETDAYPASYEYDSAPSPQASDQRWSRPKNFSPKRASNEKVSVESLELVALRTLLHHPDLARKVTDASQIAADDDNIAQLLVAVLGALQKTPNLSAVQLLARWHGTEQGRVLRSLIEKEWLISSDNLEAQFFDAISALANRQRERRLDELLRTARTGELSADEKEQLRDLLTRSSSRT